MNFQNALNTAIYNVLNGITDAGTKVYYLQAPDKETLPFIVWDYVNEGDENATPRRSKNCVAFIRAYADTPQAANTIDGQIDDAMHNQELTIASWTNFDTQREDGFSTVNNASGRKIYMSGANYRIRSDQ